MSRRERVVKVMAVVVAQLDAADADFRINVHQRRGQIEGALQRFEFVRARAPRRIIWLRIRLAGH